MTITELWKKCMPGIKKKPCLSFDVAKNLIIAMDINCWLHGLCSKPQNALMMTCDPPYPPNDLTKILENGMNQWINET